MTPLCAGIDFSSTAIHAALVPLEEDHGDPACPALTLRRVPLPDFSTYAWRKHGGTTAQYRSVARARAVKHALRSLLGDADGCEVVAAYVEEPFGEARNVMRELYGALLSHIPDHVHARALTAHQWRDQLHLRHRYTKHTGIQYAAAYAAAHHAPEPPDEHWAEATCLALAGRDQWHTDHAAPKGAAA